MSHFTDPAGQNPSESTAHSNLSVIELSKKARQKLRAKAYAEAKELFRAGLDKEPRNPYLLSGLGDACRETGDYEVAETSYRTLLEVDGDNLFALRGLGDVYKKLDRHEEAIPLWEKYLQLRPQDKHVMTRIADSYKTLMFFDRAEEVYQRILAQASQDRFALTGLADLQHRRGADAEAIRTYERVLAFDPDELHILTIIGKLCWRIGDFTQAEQYFRRALQVAPRNPYALYGLGNCFRWHRRYAEALKIWQKILEDSDGTQALHTRMGDAYFHLGRLTEAEQAYRRSLEFGEDMFAAAGLICLYLQRERLDAATETFQAMLQTSGDLLKRVDHLARRLLRTEQAADLRALFETLLEQGVGPQAVAEDIRKRLQLL